MLLESPTTCLLTRTICKNDLSEFTKCRTSRPAFFVPHDRPSRSPLPFPSLVVGTCGPHVHHESDQTRVLPATIDRAGRTLTAKQEKNYPTLNAHIKMKPSHNNPLPQRKKLPHDPPFRIDATRETFFITICLAQRTSENSLAKGEIATPLIDTVRHRNEPQVWWCSTFVIMPDHVHGLFRFPNIDPVQNQTMRKAIRNWKSWTAKSLKIKWQRNWFDHRLRTDEKEHDTAEYIRNNPVRAGLVKNAADWPFHFIAEH